jgi:hypothetical protein
MARSSISPQCTVDVKLLEMADQAVNVSKRYAALVNKSKPLDDWGSRVQGCSGIISVLKRILFMFAAL